MIKYARSKKANDFKSAFNSELASRVADKLDTMKRSIATTLFAKEDVEEVTEEERDKCKHLKAIYDKNKEDVADGEMASNDPDLARSRERYKKCRRSM